MTKLKRFIKTVRKTTISKVADELGYSREHLNRVCNGLPSGRRLGKDIEQWSGGEVTEIDVMHPNQS